MLEQKGLCTKQDLHTINDKLRRKNPRARWTRASLRGDCAGVLLLLCAPLATADFTGQVIGVLDGDTIEVLHNQHSECIRLIGIDCPEKGQAYGTCRLYAE